MAAEHVCPSSIRTDDVIWIQMGHLTQQLSSSYTSDSAAGGNDPQEAMELVMNGKQIEIPQRTTSLPSCFLVLHYLKKNPNPPKKLDLD